MDLQICQKGNEGGEPKSRKQKAPVIKQYIWKKVHMENNLTPISIMGLIKFSYDE